MYSDVATSGVSRVGKRYMGVTKLNQAPAGTVYGSKTNRIRKSQRRKCVCVFTTDSSMRIIGFARSHLRTLNLSMPARRPPQRSSGNSGYLSHRTGGRSVSISDFLRNRTARPKTCGRPPDSMESENGGLRAPHNGPPKLSGPTHYGGRLPTTCRRPWAEWEETHIHHIWRKRNLLISGCV